MWAVGKFFKPFVTVQKKNIEQTKTRYFCQGSVNLLDRIYSLDQLSSTAFGGIFKLILKYSFEAK
jgi:hypothetical protein